MGHQPERTCIGCRGAYAKNEVIRIVAGPDGIAIDYSEKLPGRAAYVCPRKPCVAKALARENLARALRVKTVIPSPEEFIARLTVNIEGKIRALISISVKAGKLAAGFSAVQDALEKGRAAMLLFAEDLSPGTKAKLSLPDATLRRATLFTREEYGRILGRELVGVIAILDQGLSDAVWRETERLNGLINTDD